MRITSAFTFEYGTKISIFCARAPLRTRASKSAIGSVTVPIKSGRLCSRFLRAVSERHPHFAQERLGFFVCLRGSDDCNIKTDVALDFIELDLGKNGLIRHPECVVAVPIKGPRRNTAKIANSRQSGFDQTLQKFVHPLPTQCHLRADQLV